MSERERVRNSCAWAGLPEVFGGDFGGGFQMDGIFGGAFGGARQPISQAWTMIDNLAMAPVTMQYMALSYAYLTFGVIQTLIDEPVDDAFKGGLVIDVPEWDDPDDIRRLQRRMRSMRVVHAFKQGLKWARLFGGGGLVIVTEQDPTTPFDAEAIKEGDPLMFLPCDRWELTVPRIEQNGYTIPGQNYRYYSEILDWSRVIRMKGREAPSRIRNLLQGWGMSELERCMRDINSFYKLQTVIYGLIDEAKVDVIKLRDLNSQFGSMKGLQAMLARVMIANQVKGNSNALLLDLEDEYEMKTQAFSGLADLMLEARINLAGAARMPVNKLFGLAATGFASGEDAMENYNQMVESDIREPAGPLLDEVIALVCRAEFGYVPDFDVGFKPMRTVDPEAEERIKKSKQERIMQLRQADQVSGKEADEILHKEDLLDIDTEVGQGLREPAPMNPGDPDAQSEGEEQGKKAADEKAKNAREKAEWLAREARRGSYARAMRRAA